MTNKKVFFAALSCLAVAIGLRIYLMVAFPSPIDADECVEALMAADLSQHPAIVVGWPGQDYLGSLEIYLLALAFPIIGCSTTAIRAAMLLLISGQLICLFFIAYLSYGVRAAAIAMIAACALSPFAYDWELRARGYQIAVLLMLAALLLKILFMKRSEAATGRNWACLFLIGLITGIAVWTNELALFLIFPLLLTPTSPKFSLTRYVTPILTGMTIGYLPRLIYHARTSLDGFKVLAGSLLHVTPQTLQSQNLQQVIDSFLGVSALQDQFSAFLEGLGVPLLLILTASAVACIAAHHNGRVSLQRHWLAIGLVVSVLFIALATSKNRYIELAVPFSTLLIGAALSTYFKEQGAFFRFAGGAL